MCPDLTRGRVNRSFYFLLIEYSTQFSLVPLLYGTIIGTLHHFLTYAHKNSIHMQIQNAWHLVIVI